MIVGTLISRNYVDIKNVDIQPRYQIQGRISELIISKQVSQARKTTRTGTKPNTQQGKQFTKNSSLNLIQDWKHKDAK